MASATSKNSFCFETKELGIGFGKMPVLDHVNVSIPWGESFVLIGPSGSGKTLLLKTLASLIEPLSGEVFFNGQNLWKLSLQEREIMTRRMGMLFQKNALFDSLSVFENVAFPLREVKKTAISEIEQKVMFYLEAVGLDHARKLFPHEISGGMQKRLGIARALVLSPEIVFYDDPTAGLDPITSRKIIDLILKLKSEMNSTVISITNDMKRAFQLADRISMTVDGELIEIGSPQVAMDHQDPRVFQFIRGRLEGPLRVVE